jgi:predicted phosphodiesterase
MRYGVLADVHGNLPALEAIVTELRACGVDRWIVAGDIVGYGAYPNECVAMVDELQAVCVAGNHDLIALGRLSDAGVSTPASISLRWTSQRLSGESRAFLGRLPERQIVEDVVVTHGSLNDVREYMTRPWQARAALMQLRRDYPNARALIVGHTHRPWAWSASHGAWRSTRAGVELSKGEPVLLNPGSVGQSREVTVRARGMLLDLVSGCAVFRRSRYDVEKYRAVLKAEGLPPESCQYLPSRHRVVLRGVRKAVAGY